MMDRYSDNESSRRDIPSFIEPRPPLIQNPFMRPRPQKGINLLEQFEEDIEEPDLVQVYLRMKPCEVPNNMYEVRSDKCLVTSLDTTTAGHGRRTQHNVSRMYTFSRIFDSNCSQKEIFEQVVKENLKKLPDGHSFTLLTYGASGSGKTYTLMGTVGAPGLVPRSLEYVFKLVDAAQMPTFKPSDSGADQLGYAQQDFELQWVKRLRQVSVSLRDKYRRMSAQLRNDLTVSHLDLSNRTKYYVWVSFVEIYNEAIYDLLAPPDKRVKMRIREDTSGNVYVKGVTQAFVRSGEEAYDVMVAGKHNLVVGATGVHAHSSRSHCIFTITMLTEKDGEIRTSHIRLCDLAGSERQRAARNTGARLQESRAINSSLHVLERCLHMLRRKQKQNKDSAMVPYRESKLTRLLGSGLSGSRGEAVSMVVTLNPAPQYAHETKHVLALAAVAQDIQINNTMYQSTLSTLESSTQDTTICSSAEVMKLRADNERLHFELLQAQTRNKELLASMEETQQQTAATMRELVEETKDMMRQYYESQLHSLKNEMDDMIEEYESRLAKSAAPPADAGTPSRYLQTKIAQLMTEITVLQDKLSEEQLARARAEKEMQHLRNCIEERDEKTFKDTSESQDEIVLTDSDDESDDVSSDPFNESLEPVFKKDQNRTRLTHNASKLEPSKVSVELEVTVEEMQNNEGESDVDKSNDTLKHDESVVASKDSMYAAGDEDSDVLNESNQIKSVPSSRDNLIQTIDDLKKTNESIDKTDNSVNDTNADKDRSDCEELFHASTKFDETRDEVTLDVIPSNLRGTYFVKNDEPQKEYFKDELIHKKINAVRGTYFVEDTANSCQSKIDIKDASTKDETKANEIKKPKKISQTLVGTIMKSLKTCQSNDNSLRTFEQLELAANKIDNSTDKSTDFVDVKMLKEKRTYFEDTKMVSRSITHKPVETPAAFTKQGENTPPMVSAKQDKSRYLKDKTDNSDFDILSKIAKTQEKRLFFEAGDKLPDLLTNTENKEKSSNFENKKDELCILSSAAKIQEKQLFFDDMDKTTLNDVLISRSGEEKRTYFDNIDTKVKSGSNKKGTDINIQSCKDRDRSPSIVKDDMEKNYEPSTAILNLLRESFTKPDLSSIHKTRVKKHESVDIFESPQINMAKAKEIILGSNETPEATSETAESNDDIEIASATKVKELSNVEMVRKSIERLVLEQKTKADNKQDCKLEPSSSVEESNDTEQGHNTKFDLKNYDLKEEIQFKVPEALQQKRDTLPSTANDTIDEFENICKNLSNVRATEFELLISQEVSTLHVKGNVDEQKPVEAPHTTKENNDKELGEKTKKLEEVKYNLRNKGKSIHNAHQNNRETEVERLLSENHCTYDSQTKTTTKRSLRLRRRKPDDEISDQDNESKLKDIINLKNEFSDVCMGLPVMKKEVKDIPSPEKMPEEDENQPPMLGIQSCPSKSVQRSRRKLFTPRAEPLEESVNQAGDSNERVYVPRPSYHRARARRKL